MPSRVRSRTRRLALSSEIPVVATMTLLASAVRMMSRMSSVLPR